MLTHTNSSLITRLATDATAYSYEELQAAEATKQHIKAAQRVIDIAMGIKKRKTRPAPGHAGMRDGKGRGAKRKGNQQ